MDNKPGKRPFQPEGMNETQQLTANAIEDFLKTLGGRDYQYKHEFFGRPEGHFFILIKLDRVYRKEASDE